MTVILSKMGWVRAATGFNVDAENMTYRGGDSFLGKASGKSNQSAIFISNLGRAYTVDIKDLPSARGQGEPISSKVNAKEGEIMKAVICANSNEMFLIATTRAYGFAFKFTDLLTKNKSGKNFITLKNNEEFFQPLKFTNINEDLIVIASKQGRLLVYKASDLPICTKGVGCKLIKINTKKLEVGLDGIAAIAIIPKNCDIEIYSGKRKTCFKYHEIVANISTKEKAGMVLNQNYQRVDKIEVIQKESSDQDNNQIDFYLE